MTPLFLRPSVCPILSLLLSFLPLPSASRSRPLHFGPPWQSRGPIIGKSANSCSARCARRYAERAAELEIQMRSRRNIRIRRTDRAAHPVRSREIAASPRCGSRVFARTLKQENYFSSFPALVSFSFFFYSIFYFTSETRVSCEHGPREDRALRNRRTTASETGGKRRFLALPRDRE